MSRRFLSVDVVAIGDSNTYGVGVGPHEPWPQQLEGLGLWSVYNMDFSGWGPGQYFLLLDEALALEPRVMIVAVYFGNDLYDAFAFGREKTLVDHMYLARFARALKYLARSLRDRSRKTDHNRDPVQEFADRNPEYCLLFDGGSFRTTFTPEYRLTGLDLEDPRIEEGPEITCALLERMAQCCEDSGTSFHVLLIPTKETVFAPWAVSEAGEVLPRLEKLVTAEQQARERITEFLDSRGIPHLDPTEALRECLRRGANPYRTTADGHPDRIGHRATYWLGSTPPTVPVMAASVANHFCFV